MIILDGVGIQAREKSGYQYAHYWKENVMKIYPGIVAFVWLISFEHINELYRIRRNGIFRDSDELLLTHKSGHYWLPWQPKEKPSENASLL